MARRSSPASIDLENNNTSLSGGFSVSKGKSSFGCSDWSRSTQVIVAIVVFLVICAAVIVPTSVVLTRRSDNNNNNSAAGGNSGGSSTGGGTSPVRPSTLRVAALQYFPVSNNSLYGCYNNAAPCYMANVARIGDYIAAAARANATVILTGESALGIMDGETTNANLRQYCEAIPVSSSNGPYNPCTMNLPSALSVLRNMSCLARDNNILVYINLCEVVSCAPGEGNCPSVGYFLLNTLVALEGGTGNVLDRYRKNNLYYEPLYVNPTQPVPMVLTTAQDVSFGHIMGLDVEFHSPTFAYLRRGVSTFMLSAWWGYNQPPQLTSLMIWQAVSRQHQINMVAANTLQTRAQGGGILSRGRALATSWRPLQPAVQGDGDLLVADLPVDFSASPMNASLPAPANMTASQATLTDLLATANHTSVPCAITAIRLPGQCTFVMPNVATPQTLYAATNEVQCAARITLGSVNQTNAGLYALQATSVRYANNEEGGEPVLVLQGCFILRCQATPESSMYPPAPSSPTTPLQCQYDVYMANTPFDQIDVFASFNTTMFAQPLQDGMPSGQVLPMMAVRDAQIVDPSYLVHEYLGCRNGTNGGAAGAGNCWWRARLTQPTMQPLYSLGMYGVQGLTKYVEV